MKASKSQAWIVTASGEVYIADIIQQGPMTAQVRWYELCGEKRSFRANTELYRTKQQAVKSK